ncbi:VOC family protein [Streptomyces sp. DSM 44915]|uniref:VOC family protein n=1 Tax=Streptomyces chisholmiae TaxID=3075540 RepID=A0ABU2JVQ7_9ACTN|nr:VOC family protein [Streptomyces sp. DSM 44915]MDT0268839.1 VOC family protein [Streptomyces sp. DSM 44915]
MNPTPYLNLDNVDLLCHDVAAMVDFYHDVLGLPFFLPYEPGQEWAALQAGNVTLYVFRTNSTVTPPRRVHVAAEDPPGLSAFGLTVPDLDAAVADLDGRVTWAGAARRWDHPSGIWYRFRPFRDPEGNVLSITEPHKSPA